MSVISVKRKNAILAGLCLVGPLVLWFAVYLPPIADNLHFLIGEGNLASGPEFSCNNTVTVDDASQKYHTYGDVVDFRIIVMSYDRGYSLIKSLQSLQGMVLDGHKAAVEVWIDRSVHGHIHPGSLEIARKFCWDSGPVRVHLHKNHAGLYGNWITTWRPSEAKPGERQELGVMLEDDVDLSKYAYRYLRKAHEFYGSRSDISGYTLCEENKVWFNNSEEERKFQAQGEDKIVFNYRILGTWGFAPHPLRWREFQDFYKEKVTDKDFKPLVKENNIHTEWYKSYIDETGLAPGMWEMWFIYFTYDRKMFTLQTRFNEVFSRSDLTLAACRKEQGIHIDKKVFHFFSNRRMTEWNDRYVNFNTIINCYHVNGSLAWSK